MRTRRSETDAAIARHYSREERQTRGECNDRTLPRSETTSRPHSPTTTRLVAAGALIALLGGISVIVLSASRGNTLRAQTVQLATTETVPDPTPAPRVRIAVTGVGAYDPDGDRSENDGAAVLATDGKPATAWKSE